MEIKMGDKIEIIKEVKVLVMKGNDGKQYIFDGEKWYMEIKKEVIG